METTQLGHTGITVSRVALGCWGFAGGTMWGPQDEADSLDTVSAALEAGINFFENAQGYGDGHAEEVLGKALRGRRQHAVIATKIRTSDATANGIEAACEGSLKRLQTDYIDLLQPHWPNRQVPPEETYQAFTRLQQAGKIRAFGVSNYGVGDLSAILSCGKVTCDQLPYSLLFRAIEYEIQPLCKQQGVGILCYSPLLHGLLAGKYATTSEVPDGRGRTRHFSSDRSGTRHAESGCEVEVFEAIAAIRQIAAHAGQSMAKVSAAWVLHQPAVSAIIAGARKPGQIRETAAAAALQLKPTTLQALQDATETVKQILGSNPDMWLSKSRYR